MPKPNPIALLIDHDRTNRRLLRLLLKSQDYRLLETESGKLGLAMVAECHPDVIILEPALSDIDGLTVLKRLRESARIPLMVLSVYNREEDIVAALDGGADDYMTKPFGPKELLARLRVLRRSIPSESEPPSLIEEDLRVDLTGHAVTIRNRQIRLTPTEEALIHTLAAHAGHFVSAKHLLHAVWGTSGGRQRKCLRVYISQLRRKLGGAAIQANGSLGYQLLLQKALRGGLR